MLRAFAPVPIVELGSKERIQAIFASREKLYVGLSSGALKVYAVPVTTGSSVLTQAKLLTTVDKFTKKAVEQLAVLEEPRVLIALSDDYVYLYDLDTYALQERVHRTKGAFVFATSSSLDFETPFVPVPEDGKLPEPSKADVQRCVSRLVVSARKKLYCYEWQGTELIGSREIAVPERCRSLTFIRPDRVLCGLVAEYFIVDISASTVSGVFAAGRPVGPLNGAIAGVATTIGDITSAASASARRQGCALAALLPHDDSVLLVNEYSSAFISADTGAFLTDKRPIKWKDVPMMLGFSYPYVLSVSANFKKLEARNPDTYSLLQSINFPTLAHLHDGKYPFVASSRQIWQLSMKPFEVQVQALVESSQFDEAISLVSQLHDFFIADRTEKLRELKMRKAEELYAKRKFQRAMVAFAEVSAPPERVLKLYPPLISGEPAEEHDEPDAVEVAVTKVKTNASERKIPKIANSANGDHDDDTASVETQQQQQQQKDIEFFDRFLRPSSAAKSTTNGVSGKNITDTSSLLGNFLSFGKSTRTTASEAGSISEYAGPDSFDEKTLNKAVRALLIYLIDARRKIARLSSVESGAIAKEDFDLVSNEKISASAFGGDLNVEATVVDTALLRCYMLINPQLVGPLVRLPNHCDKDVVREQLLAAGKWAELVDFYHTKKLHRDALELLKELGESKRTSDLTGPEPTVQYLQKLNNDDLELIFEFAKGPLAIDERYGVEIFMANSSEAESLSRTQVVKFLMPISRSLTIKYLEHLVFDLNELSPEFHNELALAYLEDIKTNAQLYSLDDDKLRRSVEKLLRLLRESKQYKPEKILGMIPRESDLFLEAKAILFSRIGEHKRALEIYVFNLNDYARAQEYCMSIYDTDAPNSKAVFHTLLELYLRPSDTGTTDMNLDAALDLLSNHGSRLSAVDALELLPPDIRMTSLGPFFEAHLRTTTATMMRDRLSASLMKAELVRTQQTLIGLRSKNVVITDTRTCPVCVKRLGSSVISVFPNRAVVHYGCAKQYRETLSAVQRDMGFIE